MPIPDKASKPVDTLLTRSCILYGDAGIGKSTLCADIPGSIILATEKGLNQMTSLKWQYADGSYVIRTWGDLVIAVKEVLASKRFGTIIIDNLTGLCWLAEQFILSKYDEDWRGDGKLGYGKGAGMIGNLVRVLVTGLANKNVGTWIIAHAAAETIDSQTGSYDRIIPSVPGDNKKRELLNAVIGSVDMVLYAVNQQIAGSDGKKTMQRVLRTQPAQAYIAKCRGEKGAPAMLDPLPLSWAKLEKAFALTQAPGAVVADETPTQEESAAG